MTYANAQYIAKFANPGYIPTISTYYWSVYLCAVAPTPAPAPAPAPTPVPAPTCSVYPAWVQGKQYAAGSVVTYVNAKYTAKFANPGYIPSISTYYWTKQSC